MPLITAFNLRREDRLPDIENAAHESSPESGAPKSFSPARIVRPDSTEERDLLNSCDTLLVMETASPGRRIGHSGEAGGR